MVGSIRRTFGRQLCRLVAGELATANVARILPAVQFALSPNVRYDFTTRLTKLFGPKKPV
jgi:hypothetical protein